MEVIVHYPKTPEGKEALEKRVAELHAQCAYNTIRRLNCPIDQKLALIDAVIKEARQEVKKNKHKER